MAQIAQAGSGKGPPACWPAEALNPWQQATHLGSPTAAAKLADQQRIFSQFNLTQDDLPECGPEVIT